MSNLKSIIPAFLIFLTSLINSRRKHNHKFDVLFLTCETLQVLLMLGVCKSIQIWYANNADYFTKIINKSDSGIFCLLLEASKIFN